MHVLIVTPWFPPLVSGAGSYLADIADGLIGHGHSVTVVLGQGAAGVGERNGVRVITVRGRVRGSTSMWMLPRSVRLHRSHPIDLVVSGGAHPVGTVAALVACAIRRPLYVVAFGEDVSIARSSALARRCLPRVFASAEGVLVPSSFTAREVMNFGGSAVECSVLAPAIDVERFASVGTRERDRFRRRHGLERRRVILTVARLDERKGHDVVLTVLASLVPEFDDIHYLIIGQGSSRRLRQLSRMTHMADRLTIVDSVDDDELAVANAAADLFVMVSRPDARGQVEGFGTVHLLGGAGAGLPCVAGNLGGCTEAVVHDVTGCCIDPTDPAAVADAICADPRVADAIVAVCERARNRALATSGRL